MSTAYPLNDGEISAQDQNPQETWASPPPVPETLGLCLY